MLLPVIFITNTFFTYNESCIEIKDRQNLPNDIFKLLKKDRAILLGEVHGSNEAAEFAEGMANLWLASGEKVLLGLEINQDNQDSVDRFMQTGNFKFIKNMPFSHREFQDGRSSTAMANLIKSFYQKGKIKIVCLAVPSSLTASRKRDSIMAANASKALSENPDWKLITLTGNVHNKLELGGFGFPMGYWMLNNEAVKLNKEQVASIDIVFETGKCWNCQGHNGTSVCKEYPQGNLSGDLAHKYLFDNFFIDTEREKAFFTREISTSFPLHQ